MAGLDVVLRAAMHRVPGAHRTDDRQLVERSGKIFEDPVRQLQVIRKATDVVILRCPRPFPRVQTVNLAHSALEVDEERLPRRALWFDFLVGAHVERAEAVEITAEETDAADSQ